MPSARNTAVMSCSVPNQLQWFLPSLVSAAAQEVRGNNIRVEWSCMGHRSRVGIHVTACVSCVCKCLCKDVFINGAF